MKNKPELKGIICALVTPLTARETIDTRSSRRLIRHVLAGGVNGILALGSTGEQASLTDRERRRFIKVAREEVPDHIPFIVGTGDTGTKRALENNKAAGDLGADAVIITPPCFYPLDDQAVIRYYEELAAGTDIPIILYNIPRFTKIKISVDVVKKLSGNPRIIGIKDSSRDMVYLRELIQITQGRESFTVIQGSDRLLLNSFTRGSPAAVVVTGNIIPGLSVQLYKEFLTGNLEQAGKLQEKILCIVEIITKFNCFPVELKTILNIKGICPGIATSPFNPLSKEEILALKDEISAINLD